MTSRLDRLFVLLESGSSSVTRRLAAKQLGEAQRLHPHELHALLSRAATLLRSSNWDTRIAASQAIEAVLQQLPPWDPVGLGNVGKGESEREHLPPAGRLTLSSLDINKVLAGAPLAACEGKEFDMEDETHGTDNLEKIACQRQLLNARLGFGGGGPTSYVDEAISEIFTNDDLTHAPLTPTTPTPNSRKQVDALMSGSLSSREMNRARRKARQAMCKQSGSTSNNRGTDDGDEPDQKKARFEIDEASIGICEVYGVPDATGSWGDTIDWPLEGLCERLWADLFSARWESRHGAATALREVLKVFGKGAGKSTDMAPTEMESQHQLWLEDAAVRLLCVLALDRLGDFVSDQVVAPVRETCAQGLGLVLQDMTVWNVQKALSILVQMLGRPEWEARHGGLLGIKYILAVREDLVNVVLPQVFPHIQRGLGDPMDDVGAVAASALIPVAPQLARFPQALGPLVSRLWDLLLDQDELASACNSFMGLLAAILSLPQASSLLQSQPLSELVPRLWPFLCHNTSSVRRATLQTLRTLTQKTTLITNETIKIEKKEFIEEQIDILITDETLKLEKPDCGPDLKMKVEQDLETVPNGGAEENVVNGLTNWPHELLQEALRHVFQRVLLEHVPEIQDIVEQVWSNLIRNSPLSTLLHAACPCVASWLCLTMHPPRVAFDPGWLIHARSLARDKKLRKGLTDGLGGSPEGPAQKWFLGGSETTPLAVREQNVIRARCMASRMLGELSCYLVKPMPGVEYTTESDSPITLYARVILTHLQSRSALQRLVVGLVLGSWAKLDPNSRPCPTVLAQALHQTLAENVYYDEIAVTFTRLLQDTRDFLSMMKHYKMDLGVEMSSVLNLEQIAALSGTVTQNMLLRGKLKPKVAESLEERRRSIQGAVNQTSSEQFMLSVSTLAAQAGAVTQLHCIPSKLNPVVRPLMEALKRETLEPLQQLSACHIAQLLDLCAERDPCPNNKVVSNLCIFVSSDSEFTPKINSSGEGPSSDSGVESLGPGGERSRNATPTPVTVRGGGAYCGILTLDDQLRMAERAAFRRSNSTTGRGPGRPPISDLPIEELIPVEDEQTQQARTARRGGTFAIRAIAEHFGADLPTRVPQLWDVLQGQLIKAVDPHNFEPLAFLNNDSAAEHLVGCLTALEVTASALHCTLLPDLMGAVLPRLAVLLGYPYKAVRHMASRSLAVFAQLDTLKVMEEIVSKVVPRLGAIECDTSRQGAAEALACVIDKLQTRIVPYVVLLVVPLLGRMSDPEQCVRMMCTHSFARLVQLFPLDGAGSQDPPGASPQLCALRAEHREFLDQLFRPQDIPDYVVPVPVKAELRSYQQSGVNWLAFLNKYRLHGVLCDDMGLGKTLQSICILAGDHYNRIKKYNTTGAVDNAPLPSLVICPPTLTGHWVYEVKKFLSSDHLRPLQYVGPPQEREKLRPKFKSHNLIVASYDIVRKDIEFFSSIKWNYCILDEGHVIKNGKTKSSKAVKQLIANHRLILSGTPIQNNVLELWSLFDFLMPGFLGTERQFTAKYSRPILASRDPKSSPKEQEAGALAMESLHRQVLPFLLRRMKEDVLQDLPPKITQDYYCDLSPLQERLYEDFSRSHLPQNLQGAQAQHTHVFQALRYLQNVCNHPKLVLTPGHPEYSKVIKEVQQQRSSLDDIQHSAKLQALKQLLLDCGIGHPAPMHAPELCVNQHRALVFCQLKSMLDIIEKDLFRVHMPALTYLRLDGSIAPAQRHAVVTRFNNDPSIDVLLLTTQVGGLGLNLTGADTVVFVEHDWNPMRDLQAMDRAHRIGQKRVVNVYRLITRATLEEKIMGLQKFKLLTANTIISNENASLETMGTDQLLDLFSLSDGTSGKLDNANSITGNGGQLTAKSVLESLPELWEDKQYEEEYDMSQFVNSLRK